MPLTPEHNIYYPNSESQFTPLESHFAAMATSVDDAMIAQAAETLTYVEDALEDVPGEISSAALRGRGTNLIPGADSIGATNLHGTSRPPGFAAFGYNSTYGEVWAQANAGGTGPTLNTDMPFFIEKGVTYRFEVTAFATFGNTRYYVQMWDPDSNSAISGTLRSGGSSVTYVASNIVAGSSRTAARTHTQEWTPDISSRAVLKFFTSHSNGASNPNGYQWFKDIRFVALESRAELDTMQDAIDAAHARIDPEPLGTRNLDSVTAQGQYYQSGNAAATSARNYPTQAAGTLTVEWWGGNSNTIIQTYKSYRGAGVALRGIFWRSTNSTGVWGDWSRLHDTDTPGVVHAEAAGSFTMGSSSNYPVGSTETRNISFPSGRFSVAPLVMVSTSGTFGSGIASAAAISTSGFRADFRRTESQAFSSGVYMWHAIQMSSNNASG